MTDLYDLGATPQDFENAGTNPISDTKRCGLCRHFEPNFHTCDNSIIYRCMSENDCCDLFEEDQAR